MGRLRLAVLVSILIACGTSEQMTVPEGMESAEEQNAVPTSWVPPIGIPAPSFGIGQPVPALPSPWNGAVAGFYYVDETSAQATDSGNSNGWPGKPRKTIPSSLGPGSVVELHGAYTVQHTSPANLRLNGSENAPVFIHGVGVAATKVWEVSGSYYVLDGVNFRMNNNGYNGCALSLDGDHGVLRHSDLTGDPSIRGLCPGGSYIVIWDDKIHDFGNVNASFDEDYHCIAVGSNTSYFWLVDSELARCSGDGIQINAGSASKQATTHHIYVGRSVSHDNKQTGFWTKQAVDVIFSQNLAYSHRESNSSPGACMGFQYAPERVWFLYNHGHDCQFGVYAGSDNGLGTGRDSYFVGNVFHNIHSFGASFNPNTAWSNAAFMLEGGINRYLVNNTVYDVEGGINVPGPGAVYMANNIVSGLSASGGSHVFVENGSTAAASDFHHSLFGGTVRIKWGGSTVYTLTSFRSAFPGKGAASLNADPLFTSPSSEGFTLQSGSPARDSGAAEAVYTTFRNLYGIDISVDAAWTSRPEGSAWDIGAYEWSASASGCPVVF